MKLHNYAGAKKMVSQTFFYLLDVGTSNALVLYNEGRKPLPPINIAQFKKLIVDHFIGERITGISMIPVEMQHIAVRTENGSRLICAFCSLHSQSSRTRFICQVCGTPLFCLSSGKTETDCF